MILGSGYYVAEVYVRQLLVNPSQCMVCATPSYCVVYVMIVGDDVEDHGSFHLVFFCVSF